jgi:hypothetical protein
LSSRTRRNDYRCGVRESSQDLFRPKQNSPEKISGLRVFDFPDYRLRSRRPVRVVPALLPAEVVSRRSRARLHFCACQCRARQVARLIHVH